MNTTLITRSYGANLYRTIIRRLQQDAAIHNTHNNGLFDFFSLLETYAENGGRCVALPQLLSLVFKCSAEDVPARLAHLQSCGVIHWYGSVFQIVHPEHFLYPGRKNCATPERQYFYISTYWRDTVAEAFMRRPPSPCDLILYLWLHILWNDKNVPYSKLYPIVYIPGVSRQNGLLSEFALADHLGLPGTAVGSLFPCIFTTGLVEDVWFGDCEFLLYSREAARLYAGKVLPFGEGVTAPILRELAEQAVTHEH